MTEYYDERNGLFYCIKAVKRFEKEMIKDRIIQETVEKTTKELEKDLMSNVEMRRFR